jgi:hypothetical protein
MADGHLNKCKDCTRGDAEARRLHLVQTDLDWVERELERQRLKQAKRRSMGKVAKPLPNHSDKWRKMNPVKARAHALVQEAIALGALKKCPCEICGSDTAQAHHEDYAKPLDVVWLCTKHHAARHVEINRQRRKLRFLGKPQNTTL